MVAKARLHALKQASLTSGSKSKFRSRSKSKSKPALIPIGWHEWCALPALRIPAIKAKIDTGAKTSALHAFNIEPYRHKGVAYVRFDIHPLQRNNLISRQGHAEVVDQRYVTSSNGHKERRVVIGTRLALAGQQWDIELTLSNRDPLQFRMLLGREAMKHHVVIDPARHSVTGRMSLPILYALYHVRV